MSELVLASIVNFVKGMGGPRSLGLMLLCALLISVVIYQVTGNRGEHQDGAGRTKSRTKLANYLIVLMAVTLVLGFMAIMFLFIYLIFMSAGN